MAISERVIKSLLRKGILWQIAPGTDYDKFINALGDSFDVIKTFFDNLRAQALPGQATDEFLLQEWSDAFKINPDLTEAQRQELAQTYYTTVGGQDFNYFKAQLEASGFLSSIPYPILADVGMDSQSGVAECGVAESGGNGVNIWIAFKGCNEGITRFYRSGGSSDIPIASGTALTSQSTSLAYVTTQAVTLLGGESYVDAPARTVIAAGDLALLESDEILEIDTPISNIDDETIVQSVSYLGRYAYEEIFNLVEYIRPLGSTITEYYPLSS